MPTRSFITVAVGQYSYLDMTFNLARSIEAHCDVPLYIITDIEVPFPADLRNVKRLAVTADFPRGFSGKLKLIDHLQTEETIFLDADTIVLRDPSYLFDLFHAHDVGIFGYPIYDGHWFGEVDEICEKLGIEHLFAFNGGFYFMRDSERTREIFDFAQSLEPRYDDIGFVRLRNQPNEEVLIGSALSTFKVDAVTNDGRHYADFASWPVLEHSSVFGGSTRLVNPPAPHPSHQTHYRCTDANPTVLHFLGHHVDSPLYQMIRRALILKSRGIPFPETLAHLLTAHLYLGDWLKNLLRPLYHRLFGYRKVKNASRYIVDDETK